MPIQLNNVENVSHDPQMECVYYSLEYIASIFENFSNFSMWFVKRYFLRFDPMRTGAVRVWHLRTDQHQLQMSLQSGLRRSDVRAKTQALRGQSLRKSGYLCGKGRRISV